MLLIARSHHPLHNLVVCRTCQHRSRWWTQKSFFLGPFPFANNHFLATTTLAESATISRADQQQIQRKPIHPKMIRSLALYSFLATSLGNVSFYWRGLCRHTHGPHSNPQPPVPLYPRIDVWRDDSNHLASLNCAFVLQTVSEGQATPQLEAQRHLDVRLTSTSPRQRQLRGNALASTTSRLESIWRDVLRAAPSGSVVLDVGAGDGRWSLLTSSLGEFVVHAFESDAVNQRIFCEALAEHGWLDRSNLQIHPMLVASRDGVVSDQLFHSLQRAFSLDNFAQEQGWLGTEDNEPTQGWEGHTVSVVPTISMLRIDTVGAVQGAPELLNRHLIKNVVLQLPTGSEGRSAEAETHTREALSILEDAGYRLRLAWDDMDRDAVDVSGEPSWVVEEILRTARRTSSRQLHLWFTL